MKVQDKANWWEAYRDQAIEQYNYSVEAPLLIVKISSQELYLIQDNKQRKCYAVSASKYGIGSEGGSNKTPLGYHKVKYKFGDDAPLGAIFRGRKFTGEIAKIYTDDTDKEEDHVTTRILWLEGLEPGKNSGKGISSFDRYIYIHGTAEEGLIGKPASHGCIRMKNNEVIELYDLVPEGSIVLIIP
ncbi:MAG: L,D-transpeptidase [Chitinophagales bacterium]